MNRATFVLSTLLVLSVSTLAFSQQREQEARSRIEGMILNASTGEPLAGAAAILRRDGAGTSEKQYGTTTGSDGHFVLKDIPKGRYLLSALKQGFVDQQYGQRQPNTLGAVLDLATAQTMRDITIRMSACGAISGRVYDQAGQPLAGTIIHAFNRKYQRDGKTLLSEVGTAVTNDIGEYRMYWLTPGTYYLVAVAFESKRAFTNAALESFIIDQSEEPPDVFAPVFYPSGDDDSQASPIRLEAGSELRAVDFMLRRTKAVRVQGRVFNTSTGATLADAVVELRLFDGLPRLSSLSAHTDDDGRFEFRNASPGKYILSARWTEPGFRSLFSRQDLQIGNKDVSDLQIALQANRSISGRVITERGEPLPLDRTVLLFTESAGTSFGTGLQPDGTFSLSNVSTGVLHLELTGFPDNFFIRSARDGSKDVLRDGLNLGENSVDSLEVIVASQGATVEGVVSDERQSPLVGARVVLMPNAKRLDRPDLFKTVTTDQYGRFEIRGAAPGDYKIFGWDNLEPNIYFDPSFMEQYESKGKARHLDEAGFASVTVTSISVRTK